MSKLHVFDMDGTLLHGSACLHISEFMGVIDRVNVIEEAWGRGEVGHVEFYELCLPLWAGLDETAITQIFDGAPWIRNVARVFEDIAGRGEFSAVITLSPMFFVDRLRGWGATSAHGADVFGGVMPDPDLVLTPASKVTITKALLQRYGLSLADCIAYGDSASDIPLFGTLKNAVAVNGSGKILAMTPHHYFGDDLWDAYHLGREMIDQAGA
jgi:phosphoserine phosphatase